MVEIKNMLAIMPALAAAESRAERTGGFHEIFERPAAYTPSELIKMVFDRTSELAPYELQLIREQAKILGSWDHELLAEIAAGAVLESLTLRSIFANFLHAMYQRDKNTDSRIEAVENWAGACERLFRIGDELVEAFEDELRERAESASALGKKAADARHDKPGGSRSMRAAIRETWASGKYSSRDICAEEECGALGVSFSAARKALRNTADPT